ncbi:class I SAM-dependent methyltransferase [Candidatus Parcubacteria bacterium]|nr:class I SAM-dependent methyltransferase [Candidatus Parcubacteria bacterium]
MDKRTIDTYNLLAKEYDEETVGFWERFPRTFIDKFAELSHGRVLDIGSGPGRDGLILKDKGLEVVCIDASSAMVELSAARGLESIMGDFTALPFPSESFEAVWAYTSLLHVPKSGIATALAEIGRVLKHQGIFGLGLIEGDEEMYRESSGIGRSRWFSYYDKEEVDALLQQHGFTTLYFEQFKPGSKNYLNFISKKRMASKE